MAASGVPVIDGAMGHFVCCQQGIYEGGDNLVVVGEILDFGSRESEPLVMLRGKV